MTVRDSQETEAYNVCSLLALKQVIEGNGMTLIDWGITFRPYF